MKNLLTTQQIRTFLILWLSLASGIEAHATAMNIRPVAAHDTATTQQGQPVTIPVLSNDNDPNGDTLFIVAVDPPQSGTAAKSGLSIVYRPQAGFVGTDQFNYTISDRHGGTGTARVTVTVAAAHQLQNDPPEAGDDAASTFENQSVTLFVLNNDKDPEGGTLSIASVGSPASGTAAISGLSLIYTPDPGFTGHDRFDYTARDPAGHTHTATVTVAVEPAPVLSPVTSSPGNRNPIARNDVTSILPGQTLTLLPLRNDRDPDGDTLSIVAVANPSLGTATISGLGVVYQANPGALGTDAFTYIIRDGRGGTAAATLSLTIMAPPTTSNTPPIASDDAVSTGDNEVVTIFPLKNDTDADGDTLSIASIDMPTHGTVTRSGLSLVYTPETLGPYEDNFTDGFSYTISDQKGGSATAVITVTIGPKIYILDPQLQLTDPDTGQTIPLDYEDFDPRNDIVYTVENQSVTIDVKANDIKKDRFDNAVVSHIARLFRDIKSDLLWILSDGFSEDYRPQARHGTVRAGRENDFIYTPDPGFTGTDQFEYKLYRQLDGGTPLKTATVTVIVDSLEDAKRKLENNGLVYYWSTTSGINPFTHFTQNSHYFERQDTRSATVDVQGDSMTLSAWVRPQDISECQAESELNCLFFGKMLLEDSNFNFATSDRHADYYWAIGFVQVGLAHRLTFRLKTNGVTTTLTARAGDIKEDEWVHIAAVYDGNSMRLYQNGHQVGYQKKTGLLDTNPQAQILALAYDGRWSGDIVSVSLYDRALSKQKIQALNSSRIPLYDVPIARDDIVHTPMNQPVTIDVAANDEWWRFAQFYPRSPVYRLRPQSIEGRTQHGSIELQALEYATSYPDRGALVYRPDPGFVGTDSVVYELVDREGDFTTATLTIVVDDSARSD